MGVLKDKHKSVGVFLAGFMVFCLFIIGIVQYPNYFKIFYINGSASLPIGIYLRVPSLGIYKVGDIVVYRPDEMTEKIVIERGYVENKDMVLFMKKIGALAGDMYEIRDEDHSFFIENEYIGTVATEDHASRPLPYQPGKFIVPANLFLPVGCHPRSFDGRYTGPVSMGNITAKVVPLLTYHY